MQVIFFLLLTAVLLPPFTQAEIVVQHNKLTNIATIIYSDGRTGSIIYNDLTNTSIMRLSDGTVATTTYNNLTQSANTTYNDGITAISTYNRLTKSIHTLFNDGASSTTSFNELTNTLQTSFSNGVKATTTYNRLTSQSTTKVYGIFLLPSMAKITFSPKSAKIRKIQNAKSLTQSQQKEEGWVKSSVRPTSESPTK